MLNIIPSALNFFNPNVGLKTNFVEKYGNYASKYKYLDALGNQKIHTTWPILAGVVTLVATFISFIATGPREIRSKSGFQSSETPMPKKTPLQIFFKKVSLVLLFVAIIFFIYAAITYFKDYKPQYDSWLKELPNDAKESLNIISTLNNIHNT